MTSHLTSTVNEILQMMRTMNEDRKEKEMMILNSLQDLQVQVTNIQMAVAQLQRENIISGKKSSSSSLIYSKENKITSEEAIMEISDYIGTEDFNDKILNVQPFKAMM